MRQIRCFSDCLGQETGDPDACDCHLRDAQAYDVEMEARGDRLRDEPDADLERYETYERDRARALPGETRWKERDT